MINKERWNSMLRQSFEPREWFERDELDQPQEERVMWVYRKISATQYEVGYYSPDKEWHEESTHPSVEEAAGRVHWLNGGHSPNPAIQEAARRGYAGT